MVGVWAKAGGRIEKRRAYQRVNVLARSYLKSDGGYYMAFGSARFAYIYKLDVHAHQAIF
jgi:hypothetical protein